MANRYRQWLEEAKSTGKLGHTSKSILRMQADAYDEGVLNMDELIKEAVETLNIYPCLKELWLKDDLGREIRITKSNRKECNQLAQTISVIPFSITSPGG